MDGEKAVGYVAILGPTLIAVATVVGGVVKYLLERKDKRADRLEHGEPPKVVQGQPVDMGREFVEDLREQRDEAEAKVELYEDWFTAHNIPLPRRNPSGRADHPDRP